jgi:hypothetical protein
MVDDEQCLYNQCTKKIKRLKFVVLQEQNNYDGDITQIRGMNKSIEI